jgi:hypothetical protein
LALQKLSVPESKAQLAEEPKEIKDESREMPRPDSPLRTPSGLIMKSVGPLPNEAPNTRNKLDQGKKKEEDGLENQGAEEPKEIKDESREMPRPRPDQLQGPTGIRIE